MLPPGLYCFVILLFSLLLERSILGWRLNVIPGPQRVVIPEFLKKLSPMNSYCLGKCNTFRVSPMKHR